MMHFLRAVGFALRRWLRWPLSWRSRAETAERETVGLKAMLRGELLKNQSLRIELLQSVQETQAATQATLRKDLARVGKGRRT